MYNSLMKHNDKLINVQLFIIIIKDETMSMDKGISYVFQILIYNVIYEKNSLLDIIKDPHDNIIPCKVT